MHGKGAHPYLWTIFSPDDDVIGSKVCVYSLSDFEQSGKKDITSKWVTRGWFGTNWQC